VRQLTLRLDGELHKDVKYLLAELGTRFNEYILELIKKEFLMPLSCQWRPSICAANAWTACVFEGVPFAPLNTLTLLPCLLFRYLRQ